MLTTPQGIDPAPPFTDLDIAPYDCLLAAVSGGSDSTALLFLLKRHLDRHGSDKRLLAVTVDHALRAGSADEAARVGRLCATLGVDHRILTWTGEKPDTGLPDAARDARHALIAQAARAEGKAIVLTGHTADDQAETVLMRKARNDGIHEARGLAGIAPATLVDGDVWFARPLLGERRAALRACLEAEGLGWIDDPTNTDQRYERARMRRTLGGADGEHAIERARALSRDAAAWRLGLGERAAGLIRAHAEQPVPGLVRLRPQFLRVEDREAALYALRILLAVAGGGQHLPDATRAWDPLESTCRHASLSIL